MRKPPSGLSAGLWIVLGLVLLYLGGAVLIFLDMGVFGGVLYSSLPESVIKAIVVIYSPLGDILSYIIPMKVSAL